MRAAAGECNPHAAQLGALGQTGQVGDSVFITDDGQAGEPIIRQRRAQEARLHGLDDARCGPHALDRLPAGVAKRHSSRLLRFEDEAMQPAGLVFPDQIEHSQPEPGLMSPDRPFSLEAAPGDARSIDAKLSAIVGHRLRQDRDRAIALDAGRQHNFRAGNRLAVIIDDLTGEGRRSLGQQGRGDQEWCGIHASWFSSRS